MIKSVGFNKVLIILLLAMFIFLALLYTWTVYEPALKDKQRSLAASRADTSEMTGNLETLTAGLEKFEKQKSDFAEVQNLGFFDPQNRLSAKQRIVTFQQESRLVSAKYVIKPAVSKRSKKLREAGYKILRTDIDFNLEAIEDSDIYKFMYLLNYGFPGQVVINSFSVSKEKEITQPLLRKIGVGQSEGIIKASISMSWKTMVPDESISVSDKDGENVE